MRTATPSEARSSDARPAPTATTLELLTSRPLEVRLAQVPPPAQPRPNWPLWALIALLGVLGLVYAYLGGTYILPWEHRPALSCWPEIPPLQLGVSFPHWLAVGDEGCLDLTITNWGSEPLTGTVAVVFSGQRAVRFAEGERNVISFAGLAPDEQRVHRLRFLFAEPPAMLRGGSASFRLWVRLADGREHCLNGGAVLMAPLPYLRTILSGLAGLMLGGLGGLLWAQLRKRFFPD